jgi:AraC family transcriptional regulator
MRGALAPADDDARMRAIEASSTGGLAGWQVRRLLSLAEVDLAGLSVSSLAGAVELSPSYFTRAFTRSFGCSPRSWLLVRRLDAAKRRLAETSDTVDQIALSLGYKSGSQLSRAFRARFGMSPQAFRRA